MCRMENTNLRRWRINTDYYYFVTDIDGDQIPELGVGPKQDAAPMAIYDLRLFSCEQTANGYELGDNSG